LDVVGKVSQAGEGQGFAKPRYRGPDRPVTDDLNAPHPAVSAHHVGVSDRLVRGLDEAGDEAAE